MADEGREWFQRVAGDTVEHLVGEITDPVSPIVLAGGPPGSGAASGALDPSLLPEGFLQEYMETHIYKDWAEVPIPALGDQAPRDALASEEGRRRVIDLLESYRRDETRQAEQQGREALDFTFLWERLGLEPPAEGR